MSVEVLITADLNNHVSLIQREVFTESLRTRNVFQRGLTTTWTVRFTPGYTREQALQYVRAWIAEAAAAARVTNYEVAAQAAEGPVDVWRVN